MVLGCSAVDRKELVVEDCNCAVVPLASCHHSWGQAQIYVVAQTFGVVDRFERIHAMSQVQQHHYLPLAAEGTRSYELHGRCGQWCASMMGGMRALHCSDFARVALPLLALIVPMNCIADVGIVLQVVHRSARRQVAAIRLRYRRLYSV